MIHVWAPCVYYKNKRYIDTLIFTFHLYHFSQDTVKYVFNDQENLQCEAQQTYPPRKLEHFRLNLK